MRSSSRSRGLKENDQPQYYTKDSKATLDSKKKVTVMEPSPVEPKKPISMKKIESGISYDPSQKSLKPLSKLDSDLSLDVDVLKVELPSNDTTSTKSKSNKISSSRSYSSKKGKKEFGVVTMDAFKTDHEDLKRTQSAHSGSHSSRDPPDSTSRSVNMNDVHSALSDEVSEMTNPTYVSNKMDPPEEKRSIKSDDSGKGFSPLVSVNSNRTDSDHTPLINNFEAAREEKKQKEKKEKERQRQPRKVPPILEHKSSDDKEQQLEDEFFGGLGWGDEKEHNRFFVTPTTSNDHSSSKDPFDDPFYTDVISSTSSKETGTKSINTDEEDDHELFVPTLNKSPVAKDRRSALGSQTSSLRESRSRSLSPTKVDIRKAKEERRTRSARNLNLTSSTRNISPTNRSTKNFSPTKNEGKAKPQSIYDKSPSSSHLFSPGIKLGQNKVLAKSDNSVYGDRRKVTSPVRAPSFLAKRQSQIKKEEDIRARLQKQKQNLENVTRAAEIGRRRGDLIEKASTGLHLSSLRSRSTSLSPTRSASPKKGITLSPNKYSPRNSQRQSINISNRSNKNSRHVTKSSYAAGGSYTQKLLNRKKTFNAPSAFGNDREVSILYVFCLEINNPFISIDSTNKGLYLYFFDRSSRLKHPTLLIRSSVQE